MESEQHDDDFRSYRTTDTIRVPDQKVQNYRSDRWIALKLFARVSGGCFTWSSVESVMYDDDVQSGRTTDTIRVPDQKVHNYRSDRWIALKLFARVSGGCFTWSTAESVLYDDAVRSGRTTDTIRVPDQKVLNYRSDRWIAQKCFHEFPEAVLHRVGWNRYCTTTMSGRAVPPTRYEYRIKRSITIDPTVGSL